MDAARSLIIFLIVVTDLVQMTMWFECPDIWCCRGPCYHNALDMATDPGRGNSMYPCCAGVWPNGDGFGGGIEEEDGVAWPFGHTDGNGTSQDDDNDDVV